MIIHNKPDGAVSTTTPFLINNVKRTAPPALLHQMIYYSCNTADPPHLSSLSSPPSLFSSQNPRTYGSIFLAKDMGGTLFPSNLV